MGGHKFQTQGTGGEHALYCPRLPHDLYTKLRDRVIASLQDHFDQVIVPITGPKIDHGDVDILVCGPIGEFRGFEGLGSMKERLSQILGASRFSYDHGTLFVASPIPKEFLGQVSSSGDGEKHDPEGTEPPSREPYIQYDLIMIDTPSLMTWNVFRQAHGDLLNILQTGLQEAGFTFNPSGLYVRIPEIEKIERKESFLFLSNEPEEVLTFFGLDPAKHSKAFESDNDLFEWISSCIYFSWKRSNECSDRSEAHSSPRSSHLSIHSTSSETSAAFTPCNSPNPSFTAEKSQRSSKKLARYFKYMDDRVMFERFKHDWLPAHPQFGGSFPLTREEILAKAIDFFDVQDKFLVKVAQFNAKTREQRFWTEVNRSLPKFLGENASKRQQTRTKESLKRFVRFEEYGGFARRPVICEEAQMIAALQPCWTSACDEGGFTENDLLEWIDLHWERVFELERQRDRPRRVQARWRKAQSRWWRWLWQAIRAAALGSVIAVLILAVLFVSYWTGFASHCS